MAGRRSKKPIRESILGDVDDDDIGEILPWHTHDWSTQEVNFVSEYMRTGDECRAYRYAFDVKREESEARWVQAGVRGRVLLATPWMASYVAELQVKLRARLKMDTTTILEELAKLGYANMSDFVVLNKDGEPQFDLSGLSREQSAAIQELTIDTYVVGRGEDARSVRSVKVKLAPKVAPLELMGKHYKMWTDVVEQKGDTDLAEEIKEARRRKKEREANGDDGEVGANDGSGDGEQGGE